MNVVESETRVAVGLPTGESVVSAAFSVPADPWAAIAIAHGAGTRMDHPFLVGFAAAMAQRGVAAMRFNFAYSEAGRRMPGPATHAIAAWAAVDTAVRATVPRVPVVASGRSYGGRMASMAAAEGSIAPAALVYLGYPLHPPGRPDRPRIEHLPAITPPQLFLSGESDPFVDPHVQLEQAVASCQDAVLEWVPGGHGFEVKGRRTAAGELGADIAARVERFLRARLDA
jgi:predicted alpha/beta-hydrolase family hydrolase